jgi:hypothetical protein
VRMDGWDFYVKFGLIMMIFLSGTFKSGFWKHWRKYRNSVSKPCKYIMKYRCETVAFTMRDKRWNIFFATTLLGDTLIKIINIKKTLNMWCFWFAVDLERRKPTLLSLLCTVTVALYVKKTRSRYKLDPFYDKNIHHCKHYCALIHLFGPSA